MFLFFAITNSTLAVSNRNFTITWLATVLRCELILSWYVHERKNNKFTTNSIFSYTHSIQFALSCCFYYYQLGALDENCVQIEWDKRKKVYAAMRDGSFVFVFVCECIVE